MIWAQKFGRLPLVGKCAQGASSETGLFWSVFCLKPN